MSLPKPQFKDADETSISLSSAIPIELLADAEEGRLKLQYKQIHENWIESKMIQVQLLTTPSKEVEASISTCSIVDLNPGNLVLQ